MPENRAIAIAVGATAAASLIIAATIFFIFYRYTMSRRNHEMKNRRSSFRREELISTPLPPEFRHDEEKLMQHHGGGTLRGLLVEENGKDVLYLRKADGGRFTSCFSKVWFNPIIEQDKMIINVEDDDDDDRCPKPCCSSPNQEIPLISKHDSSSDHYAIDFYKNSVHENSDKVPSKVTNPYHLPPLVIPSTQTPVTPPPPPPPPPPAPPTVQNAAKPPAPPPPPPSMKRSAKPPPSTAKPLPPKPPGGFSKPPAHPTGRKSSAAGDAREAQTKLKPLHWDKVPTNADHSMVWHEIVDGSFRFDDQLMESLFGIAAQNQARSEAGKSLLSTASTEAQIFLLDPRKSQNTAIVLRSLAISRREILEALQDGFGLSSDTLEKLTKISPSPEEQTKIIQFDGNPTKLADAESFLYHILRAVPSAFLRINAMLFRSSYDPDILHLKESLQTLELGCKELRNRGVFFKLLEAILKAGNRMNAGTARGDAQGFNLTALRKLSFVKSTDGKTTLLHFVVEQVIRSEGKRCFLEQTSDETKTTDHSKEEDEKEHIRLGLPIVSSLNKDFSNVKKAASIEHDSFIKLCPNLTARADEIRHLVSQCGGGGFVREMKGFLEECEAELKVVREEQSRVMQLVRRTTEYYQAGAAGKERAADPLQLFAIVKDFLGMVDQACADISKKMQRKKVVVSSSAGSSPPTSPLSLSPRTPVRFQNLQSYFQTGTMSSDSDDDF